LEQNPCFACFYQVKLNLYPWGGYLLLFRNWNQGTRGIVIPEQGEERHNGCFENSGGITPGARATGRSNIELGTACSRTWQAQGQAAIMDGGSEKTGSSRRQQEQDDGYQNVEPAENHHRRSLALQVVSGEALPDGECL
jgi:hypothetical protein